MKTATFIRDVKGGTGTQRLYKVNPPVEYGYGDTKSVTEYVVTSATKAMFSGPETYIFPADADGTIVDWSEMDGSFRGDLCHETALSNAGYSLT